MRTSTLCAASPRPRCTDKYTLCDVGCTAMSRMTTSSMSHPRNEARRASTLATSNGSDPAAAPWSATSTANTFAETLSARNRIPAGPNVIGPADRTSAVPIFNPYSLIATSSRRWEPAAD